MMSNYIFLFNFFFIPARNECWTLIHFLDLLKMNVNVVDVAYVYAIICNILV